MFARATNKNKKDVSHIADDVTDLLNEMDRVAAGESPITTAHFDESIVVTKQDAGVVIVEGNDELASPNTANTDRHSPDLSLQVSELSTSLEELAFLEQGLKQEAEDAPIANDDKENLGEIVVPAAAVESTMVAADTKATGEPPIDSSKETTKQEEGDSKMLANVQPQPAADKSLMGKLWSTCWTAKDNAPVKDNKPATTNTNPPESPTKIDAPADTPIVKNAKQETKDESPATPTKDNGEFNPFVNIGNRLLDDHSDDDSYKYIMEVTGKVLHGMVKVVGVLATIMMQILGVCARNAKFTGIALLIVVFAAYIKSFFSFSVTISVQPSAWNSSMMEDLTPPPSVVEVDDIVMEENAELMIQDWIVMLQVLMLSMTVGLTGLSILGKATGTSTTQNEDALATYCKHEDDRSRYVYLNIKELKNALRTRGLSTTGNHSHLVDRLVAHDNGESTNDATPSVMGIDVPVVYRNTTVKILQEKLRTRKLPTTGLKEDLIAKMWIPARVQELQVFSMKELRALLEENKLSQHGKSQAELIRRLVEAGH